MPGLSFPQLIDPNSASGKRPIPGLTYPPLLIDPAEGANPRERAEIEVQNRNVTRGYKEINAELATGNRPWIETNWDVRPAQAARAAQVEGSADPLAVLGMQTKVGLDGVLAGLAQQRDALNQSIAPDLDAAYRDYMIDFQTLTASNMDAEQKQERARALEASYQKKAFGIKDQIRGGVAALDQAGQQAQTKFTVERMGKEIELRSYQKLADEGVLDTETVRALQFRTLGVPYSPASAEQSPQQAIAEIVPNLRAAQHELEAYASVPAKTTGRIFKSTTPASLKILKPQYRADLRYLGVDYAGHEDLFQDATPEEATRNQWLQQYIAELAKKEWVYRNQIFERHVPTLSVGATGTKSPLAQSVAAAGPNSAPRRRTVAPAEPTDLSKMSDEELRRIVGM